MNYELFDQKLCVPVEVLSELAVDRVVDNGIDQCCRHCQEVDCKVDILDAVVISNAWRGIVLNTYWTFIHCKYLFKGLRHCSSKTPKSGHVLSTVSLYLQGHKGKTEQE